MAAAGRTLCLLISALLLSACSNAFFYPMKLLLRTPADLDLNYEEVHFASLDEVKLHGWFLPAENAALGTVLFLHGNAENISTHIGAVMWLPKADYNVFLFDYRGYGHSAGQADLTGAHLDSAAALRYLRTRADIDPHRLIVFGQSIGGAIAWTTVAHEDQSGIRALVVESAFSSYRGIAREKLAGSLLTWAFQWPLALTIDDDYSPLRHAHALDSVPKLIIHGETDPVVPLAHAQRLYAAAGGDKQLWVVPHGGHIEAFGKYHRDYRPALLAYFQLVLDSAASD